MAKGKAVNIAASFEAVNKALSGIAESLEKNLVVPLEKVTNSIAEFGSRFQDGITNSLGRVAESAIKSLSAATNVFALATSKAVQQMLAFVSKADPAAAFRFNLALNDLAGTMGQILAPVLESITGFVREFADVLQGMRPLYAPIMQGISIMVNAMKDVIGPAMLHLGAKLSLFGPLVRDVIAPIVQALAMLSSSVIALLGPELEAISVILNATLIPALATLASWFKQLAEFIKDITDLIPSLQNKEKGDSMGAAVRPAAYGKIEDIGKRTTLAALNTTRNNDLTADGKAVTSRLDDMIKILKDGTKDVIKDNVIEPLRAARDYVADLF